MALPILAQLQADEIRAEIATVGSAPLLVIAGGAAYFVKTTLGSPPRVELINEVIANYAARCWNLRVPDVALLDIPPAVVENYLAQGNTLSPYYPTGWLSAAPFFASRQLLNCVEVEPYLRGLTRREFGQFADPLDIVRIGLLDLWLANRDRRPENPNLLLQDTAAGFHFYPIDHAATFGYCTNYKALRTSQLFLEEHKRILVTPLVKDIGRYASAAAIANVQQDVLAGMQATLEHLDFIFEQIPSSWGCSRKARARLREVLADEPRNRQIAAAYRSYLT